MRAKQLRRAGLTRAQPPAGSTEARTLAGRGARQRQRVPVVPGTDSPVTLLRSEARAEHAGEKAETWRHERSSPVAGAARQSPGEGGRRVRGRSGGGGYCV